MSISLLKVFRNDLAITVSRNELNPGCLNDPTALIARKFQVFLMFFEESLISFLLA
jgi:hypothetical protein